MELLSTLRHTLPPTVLLGLPAAALVLLVAVVVDYRAWINFGTGGTPPNLHGYLKITRFRVLRLLAHDDLKDASKLPTGGPSYIMGQLRKRTGPRPKVFGRTLPQRQYPKPLDSAIYKRLHNLPQKYAAKYPDLLDVRLSITEGRSTDAIYSKVDPPSRAHDNGLGDEIAHVHPAENSLHVWLAVADAKKVVESGWGERFPLSSLGMVDDGWTFVYAPRSMEDLDVIEEIVRAGIGHLTGKEVQG